MNKLPLRWIPIAVVLVLGGSGLAIASDIDNSGSGTDNAADLDTVEIQTDLLVVPGQQPAAAQLDLMQLETASDEINTTLIDNPEIDAVGPVNGGDLPSAEPAPSKVTIDILQ